MILTLLMSFSAHAGWFGPSESDERLVKVEKLPFTSCAAHEAGFKISNGSAYTVDKVEFRIVGKEEGHSTEYDLSKDHLTFDKIMKKGETVSYCIDLSKVTWPANKKLVILATDELVTFGDQQ